MKNKGMRVGFSRGEHGEYVFTCACDNCEISEDTICPPDVSATKITVELNTLQAFLLKHAICFKK